MYIECGPNQDRRVLTINLPGTNQPRVGVFVSGGIDSALLYYLLMKLNAESNTHKIIPFTLLRKEGSKHYAKPIINYINQLFGKPEQELTVVGNVQLAEDQQVKSGVQSVLHNGNLADIAYVGVIQTLDIHMVGWQPILTKEGPKFKTPFMNLNKSHIIDLVLQFKQEYLFEISHSCIYDIGRCGNCNGCNERSWGFSQLNKIDHGSV